MLKYNSIADLVKLADERKTSIAKIVIQAEAESSETSVAEVNAKMDTRLAIFRHSINEGLADKSLSASGMVGMDADKLTRHKPIFFGKYAYRAMRYALAVSEGNAKMHRIVACPTAGSCGIVPAVVFALGDENDISPELYREAMFSAAGIGNVIAENACVAGAVGGCQAECGAAAAMAAGAAVHIMGGSNTAISMALTLALKNVLGLVCDPVAQLVEVPCVKRNGFHAVHALVAAEMALAGIQSVIPPDEVIGAMFDIGKALPVTLRETSEGGLAVTATGKKIQKALQERQAHVE